MGTHPAINLHFLSTCSAGIGRTGTFIVIDHLLEQIAKEKLVDIPGVITEIRRQRMMMVQTVVSYTVYLFQWSAIVKIRASSWTYMCEQFLYCYQRDYLNTAAVHLHSRRHLGISHVWRYTDHSRQFKSSCCQTEEEKWLPKANDGQTKIKCY